MNPHDLAGTSTAPGVEIPSMPPGTTLTTLENGLVIIVREDHTAPVVSAQAWCMSGSIHEGKWLGAGLSHVLEHMLFKGTTTRPGSRIDQEVQEAGGYMNAYTSFDRTVYHIDVPSTGSATAIDILCDVMRNATLPAEELEKEKQVIVREMDMNVDDPQRRASRRLFEVAYTRSPYRYTVIGYPDIFHSVSPEDITTYYREKYVPNNVFYVVVGDVKTTEVLDQIRNAYGALKSKPLPPMVLPTEPAQIGIREVIEEAPIELGYAHYAWHIPDLRHPDAPALDVLAAVLGSGRSSRLYRNVRETKALVHSVSAWTYSSGGQGLFGISSTFDPGNMAAARNALIEELERLRTEFVPPAELAKALKQFLSGTLAARKTMQGQAQDLGGSWMAANDLNFSERFLAAIEQVTPETLLRVAREYLDPNKRSAYCLLPNGSAPVSANKIETATIHPIRKFELPNGLRLLVKEDHRLPFVEFRAFFQGGVLGESPDKNGVTQLLAKLLLKGTASRSAEQIAQAIEEIGGSIDTYGGNNSFGVNVEVLRPDFTTGMDVLADVLLRATFPEESLEREREAQLAAIRSQKDHLLRSAFHLMRRNMFGETGYGLDPAGEEESVRRLSRADLLELRTKSLTPENCVISIFGDIEEQQTVQAVQKAFESWNRGAAVPASTNRKNLGDGRSIKEERDKKQSVVVLGFPGLTLSDPRRYALDLLQEACSDLGSRLFMRVREKLGLAYYVGAQNFLGLAPGYFAFYAGTMPDAAQRVEEELKNEAELLKAEGLSEEELKRAKAKIIGQRKIERQDLGQQATVSGLDELYGLGYEKYLTEDALYEAVTLEDIREVARTQLQIDKSVVCVVGALKSSA